MNLLEDAFKDIIGELKDKKKSLTFGVMNRRNLPPDFSRQNYLKPKLYKHLLDFAEKFIDISYNSIVINPNCSNTIHKDKNSIGETFLIATGNYTGGEVKIYDGLESRNFDICGNPLQFDMNRLSHSFEPYEGNRVVLMYYNLGNKKLGVLPKPSVREENGRYYFYKDDEKIVKPESKNKKKDHNFTFTRTIGNFTIEFK